MRKQNLVLAVMLMSSAVLSMGCSETPQRQAADRQQQIALGEKVFQEKKCGKCHSITGLEVETAKVEGLEVRPPDLSSVFLAIDTLFIKRHLQFTELTAMPPITMTRPEINAMAQYVASLHAKANADPNLSDADGSCPVCGARLQTSEAAVAVYEGKEYYFECPDCKVVFERDPAWHTQSGHL